MRPFSAETSEWLTRKHLIDPKLKAAGWRVVPFNSAKSLAAYDRCAIEEFPTAERKSRHTELKIKRLRKR
jgi:type I site-specific restriction endonuclease